jgi:NAD(P)-dependent dehydrogenase (short-subunit alcohol dehydrogenase family)
MKEGVLAPPATRTGHHHPRDTTMEKVVIITGTSRGLGRHLAEAVLQAGHKLVATARRPEQLGDLERKYRQRICSVALDVTDSAAARGAVRTAIETFGRLDVVINNAGYGDLAAIEDVTDENFRAQIDTNFYGVVNLTRAALPILREQRSGHIIQISSLGGRIGTVGLSAYVSAKWAVGGFSEVLAQEVAPFGVKVSIIEPGGLRTDWSGSSMTIPPVSEPYQATVGAFAAMLRAAGGPGGQSHGDPRKAAQVIVGLIDLAEPPLRLLLGKDAVQYAQQADQARAASDARWRHLSDSIGFDSPSDRRPDSHPSPAESP